MIRFVDGYETDHWLFWESGNIFQQRRSAVDELCGDDLSIERVAPTFDKLFRYVSRIQASSH